MMTLVPAGIVVFNPAGIWIARNPFLIRFRDYHSFEGLKTIFFDSCAGACCRYSNVGAPFSCSGACASGASADLSAVLSLLEIH